MSNLNIPFNVELLDPTPDDLRGLKPIRVSDIYQGGSGTNFHEDGLFSTSIFGRVGDKVRNRRFSYIDIKVKIFHPIIYKCFERLRGFYADIITGKEFAIWNPAITDFERATAINGMTGFNFFVEHWREIKFQRNKSDIRNQMISLLEKYADDAMIDKIIVIPAGIRDVEITRGGRTEEHEINPLYRKLINVSSIITEAAIRNNPEIIDRSRLTLQLTFNQIYEMLENMVNGKHKLILGKWATRRIFNTTRNVASSMDTTARELGAPENVRFNNTVIGLYQALRAFLPKTVYMVRNKYVSKIFVTKDQPVNLVNTKTLKSEPVKVRVEVFDAWTSNTGMEQLFNIYENEDIRHRPVMINSHYLALIYKGKDGTFKVINDIDDVPPELDKTLVEPITYTELFYCSIYQQTNKFPFYVTRYPITGIGSIYPSLVYLKPTNRSEVRQELSDSWEPMGEEFTALAFPTKSSFVNTQIPHSSKLTGLGADFDGDTLSGSGGYADDTIEEAHEFLHKRKAYIGTDGHFIASVSNDTTNFVFRNMTRG